MSLRKLRTQCCLAFAVVLACAQGADAEQEKGWVFTQRSCTLGPITVWVTPARYRFYVEKMGLSIIAKAPYSRVLVENEHNKKFMLATPEEAYTMFGHEKREQHGVWKLDGRAGVQNICGVKAVKYDYFHEDNKKALEEEKRLKAAHDTHTKPKYMYRDDKELWCARDIVLPDKIALVLERLMSSKEIHPLMRDIEIGKNGKKAVLWETVKTEHKTVDSSVFEVPKDYRKATNHIALIMSDDGDDSPLGMFDDTSSIKKKTSHTKVDLDSSPF